MSRDEGRLFAALLRHFRTKRGLSQLDLALSAEVSSRHVSFLETGRALPSRDMVLTLGAALDVPLRDQNAMLRAAGFAHEFSEPSFATGLPELIERAITRMLAQQEPYPMVVLGPTYDVLRANQAALKLLPLFVLDPSALVPPLNIMRGLFDPRLVRSFVLDWERVAQTLLSRMHREALVRANDTTITDLIRELLAYPDVPKRFHTPDLSLPMEPVLSFRLRRGDLELGFFTTITVFSAPQNITLEELRIESYFPADEASARHCERMLGPDSA